MHRIQRRGTTKRIQQGRGRCGHASASHAPLAMLAQSAAPMVTHVDDILSRGGALDSCATVLVPMDASQEL